ncbi:unnamed protein product [Ectocarpus sp. 4 AP-2014]
MECSREVKYDLAQMPKSVNEYRAESVGYLGSVTDSLEATLPVCTCLGFAVMKPTESPTTSKRFVVNKTLETIVEIFAPLWADKARSATPDGKKVLSSLLNVVSCVCALPLESELSLPCLDKRLLPAFASLCTS